MLFGSNNSALFVNTFLTIAFILYPLKTLKNLSFLGVIRGYNMETLVRNGLKTIVLTINFPVRE